LGLKGKKIWYEHITNKIMLDKLFEQEILDLNNAELHSINIQNQDIKISFITNTIPKKYPKKWDKKKFNALSINLRFSLVTYLESNALSLKNISNPTITTSKEKSTLELKNKEFLLKVESKFLTLDGIIPYEDKRWD